MTSLLQIDPYVAMPLVVIVMAVFGFLSFNLIMRRVLNTRSDIQMLATMAVMMLLENLALMLFRADYRVVRTPYSNEVIDLGGLLLPVPRLVGFAVSMLCCFLLYMFLQKTYLGKSMRAISQNNKAAQLMGIRLKWTYGFTFTLGIALTGVFGALAAPIYSIYPTVGGTFLLPAFVVVVIGGLSSVPGAIIGGLLVGVVENLSALLLGTYWQRFGHFVMFILVLIIKTDGILSSSKKRGDQV